MDTQKVSYISVLRKKGIYEVKSLTSPVKEIEKMIEKMSDLSKQYGVSGDDGDITFYGSQEKALDPIPFWGFNHKEKSCGNLYNEELVIVNKDKGFYSLSKEQIDYFMDMYANKKELKERRSVTGKVIISN